MIEYNVDIFKDAKFKEPLISIKVGEVYFENIDHFLYEVANQLEDKGIIQDRESNDQHSLILVNAIGFKTEKPIKNDTRERLEFSLAIPENVRK